MTEIRFTVLGIARPAGSKRAVPIYRGPKGSADRQFVRTVVIDANKNAGTWKNDVAAAASVAYTGPLLDGPLYVDFRIFLPRPQGHSGKKGLLPSAPSYPRVKPDVLKLARGLEDALTGVVWRDDAQIVTEKLMKVYGEPARVEVLVRQLPATAAEAGLVQVQQRLVDFGLFAGVA